ncbi:DUF1295 domain-containing protein [Legionella hackeliae]|uniref:Uncharacterized protein n=1 Tax=Legionella hackeliae TaxID=449 RepID=A0A0A8US00_LEGHA|nr:DUF1295 domain-containing protein [Legionella hackeliae]KTD13175.1 hypothetical protein Lhac_1044 [Legionella hackeliae]CEK11513.1 conserved membrane protein of unknown function [Legionella hackeliae]STX48282.1 Predicted membrane protein [Legionella hackeliae]
MRPLAVIALIFVHMSLIWLWYRITNNPSVVDVGWASGLTLTGLLYLNSETISYRSALLSLILLIWGLRLGFYLWHTRIRKKLIDKRYIVLSNNWKIAKSLGFFINFQLQGFFIFIISLPWFFASLTLTNQISLLDGVGLILAALFIGLETVADYQLQSFRAKNPGKVCNQGLWYYSRHPNYFFEWLVWCSFTLFASHHSWGWLALLSPITLYWLMTWVTGPMTERGSIESKGQLYINYQKSTPMFFPTKLLLPHFMRK